MTSPRMVPKNIVNAVSTKVSTSPFSTVGAVKYCATTPHW